MQGEIDAFSAQQGLPHGIMPFKMDFVRANRYDLSHAVERWGGLYELAEMLGYQVCGWSFCPSGSNPAARGFLAELTSNAKTSCRMSMCIDMALPPMYQGAMSAVHA